MSQKDNTLLSSSKEKLNQSGIRTEYTRARRSSTKISKSYKESRKSSDKKDDVSKQQTTKANEKLMTKEIDNKSEEQIKENETDEEPELTEVELAVVAGVILEKIDNGLAKSSVSKPYNNSDFAGFNQREDTVCLELNKNVLQDFLLGLTLLEKICRSGCVTFNQSQNVNQNQNISVEKAKFSSDEIKTIRNWKKQVNFSHFVVNNHTDENDLSSKSGESPNIKAGSSPNENAVKGLTYSIIEPVKLFPNKNNAESSKPNKLNVNNIDNKKTPKTKLNNHPKSTLKSTENITLETKVSRVIKRKTKRPIRRRNLSKTVLKNKPNVTVIATPEPEPDKLMAEETKDDVLGDDMKPDKAKIELMKTNFEKEWSQIIPPISKKDAKVVKKVRRRRKPVVRNYLPKLPAEWEVVSSEDGGPPYKCPVCPFQHRVKANTRRHMVIHLPDELCTWYKCNQCDYKSKRQNVLKNHFLVHKTADEITWYHCTICEAKFKHKTALAQHSIRHKAKEECRLYSCDLCRYTSPFRYALKRHMLTHRTLADAAQYYKCPICDYKCLNKFYLPQHLKLHEKPAYKCNQCSFETHWKSNLNSHKISHNREDFLIECDFCDFKTLWKYSLNKHKLKKHRFENIKEAVNKKVIYCANCDYTTPFKRCLVSHMAMHKRVHQTNVKAS